MTKARVATILLVVLSIVVTSAVFITVGEIVFRQREARRTTVPTMATIFYRHDRLRHALIRDNQYYRWVTVNEHGFRGPSVAVNRTPGTLRIMVVGGSTAFDSFVSSDDRAWPARLEHWLECAAPESEIEVINAGVPGYVMLDNLIRLQTELYRFQPDVLILYQAHNDLLAALHRLHEANEGSRMPYKVVAISPWKEWLEQHSLLYTKVVGKAKLMQRQAKTSTARTTQSAQTYEAALDAGVARHEKDLRSLLAIANAFGIRVVIPETVHIGERDPAALDDNLRTMWLGAIGLPPEHMLAGYTRYEEATREMARRLGVTYLPLGDAGLGAPELYSEGDPIHFNDQGADQMGAAVAAALNNAGVIPGASTSPPQQGCAVPVATAALSRF